MGAIQIVPWTWGSKVTHGGRHAGAREAQRLDINYHDIAQDGRWTAPREMREVDWRKSEFEQYKDEEVLARVLPDLVTEACQAARKDRDKGVNSGVRKESTAIFGDDDTKRRGLLRLLVRCRRIILQDAAWLDWKARAEKKPVAPILLMHSNIFEDPEFIMFQQRLIVAMQLQKDVELKKLKEAIPSIADVLTRMTERQNQWQSDMDSASTEFSIE
ncbi:hypothetical protein BGX20_001592 [Mortierella sp. AD010]|nr:hypothetical protein BGX20_001592 [Mortierella sp. AD010]